MRKAANGLVENSLDANNNGWRAFSVLLNNSFSMRSLPLFRKLTGLFVVVCWIMVCPCPLRLNRVLFFEKVLYLGYYSELWLESDPALEIDLHPAKAMQEQRPPFRLLTSLFPSVSIFVRETWSKVRVRTPDLGKYKLVTHIDVNFCVVKSETHAEERLHV